MEDVHGVDVSWIHHQGDKAHAKPRTTSSKSNSSSRQPTPPLTPPASLASKDIIGQHAKPEVTQSSITYAPSPSQPQPIPQKSSLIRRPGMRSKSSQEKLGQSPDTPSKRSGWMQSLSSKFGSASKGNATTGTLPGTAYSKTTPPPNLTNSQSLATQGPEDDFEPYVPQQPESGSFFSSALRRLSTSTPGATNTAKAGGKVGMCPRQVLNIDETRRRCQIKELNPSRLRRVAFSVDVEIAGGSQYSEEPNSAPKQTNDQDKKIKERSEGEALKRPQQALEEIDASGKVEASPGPAQQTPSAGTAAPEAGIPLAGAQDSTGPAPATPSVIIKEQVNPEPAPAPPRSHDRPTTDPVRMYRRCCQLREAPVLKRISEQLSHPTRCGLEKEGLVGCLDLRGSRMQLQDVACLGDWLALVPLRKLLLDNANLTDEGLRYILAGLLAARPPEMRKRKRGRSNPAEARPQPTQHTPGVIEKLTLKNNPKITVEGWKYICTFLNMSRSIKAIDVSMIPFPKYDPGDAASVTSGESRARSHSTSSRPDQVDMAEILFKAIAERERGGQLNELTMCECSLTTRDVRKIVDAATVCGLDILGLAKNNLDHEAIQHAVRMLRSKTCKGLDLGGNDLRNAIPIIAESLSHSKDIPLWGLSLADCNIETSSLDQLFQALAPLANFRFIDLSHNRELFSATPSAQGVLRKYLPQLKWLRRIHLNDVSMSPAQAISLAEILPEVRNLNHVSLLENPQLKELAESADPKAQADACALYASLMVAVRVSKTMFAIDIDTPGEKTNEVVRAIFKQLAAYTLRNIERFTSVDAVLAHDPAGMVPDLDDSEDTIMLPDVIVHLVGPNANPQANHDHDDELGPDEDYIVGGTGVVKALSYCLNERERASISGAATPSSANNEIDGKVKAKEMSKNLLGSARKIRTRLEAAMRREAAAGDDMSYRRLHFLDHTLHGIIERFEAEYPDCRLPDMSMSDSKPSVSSLIVTDPTEPESPPGSSTPEAIDTNDSTAIHAAAPSSRRPSTATGIASTDSNAGDAATPATPADEDPSDSLYRLPPSRRASETSLASKALAREEGSMHRFGQRIRRDLLPPAGMTDHLHGTSAQDPAEAAHLRALREKLEQLGGDSIREKVVTQGLEATFREWDGLARAASPAGAGAGAEGVLDADGDGAEGTHGRRKGDGAG